MKTPTKFEDCGTPKAYHRHKRRGEDADQACKDAIAEYARTREKKPYQGPKPPPPCGTDRKYHWHVRHHEEACDECKRAHADARATNRAVKQLVDAMRREAR